MQKPIATETKTYVCSRCDYERAPESGNPFCYRLHWRGASLVRCDGEFLPVLEQTPGACPTCGASSLFGGTVVWCPCSGWVDGGAA